tara:strand:- start:2805 stop:3329 length:525 start_codon:yes stop_codon:yes gene_type:complete
MKLSTKARYAVLALVDLALHGKKIKGKMKPISLIDISQRQNISQQYLEQLFSKLRKSGVVQSVRGQNGGYFLAIPPTDLCISQIVDAVEEPIKSTKCDPNSQLGCQGKQSKCLAHPLWVGLETSIRAYLTSVTLNDVMTQRPMPFTVMTRPQETTPKSPIKQEAKQDGNMKNAS